MLSQHWSQHTRYNVAEFKPSRPPCLRDRPAMIPWYRARDGRQAFTKERRAELARLPITQAPGLESRSPVLFQED